MDDERVVRRSTADRFDYLDARLTELCNGIGAIKAMLQTIEERVRKLENNEAGMHPLMESRIDAAWRKLEDHDRRIELLAQTVARLDHSNKLIAGLGSILASTVVIWLVTQILQVIK